MHKLKPNWSKLKKKKTIVNIKYADHQLHQHKTPASLIDRRYLSKLKL